MRNPSWARYSDSSARLRACLFNGIGTLIAHRAPMFRAGCMALTACLVIFKNPVCLASDGLKPLLKLSLALLTGRSLLRRRTFLRRMSQCRRCPLFNKTLKTCGTPGNTFQHQGQKLRFGCTCYLPLKNRIPCNCWLYDFTDGLQGWPDHLNSKPILRTISIPL